MTKYAVVDIETTGGYAAQHGIIEIAIVVTDGKTVLDKFETLIDPGVYIPRFITGLTGIDNHMVKGAPVFSKVADKIYELLKDSIFVAHNVNFDYSFVKAELEGCNYTFKPNKLCTVRLGRKIFPGYKSYNLASLCGHLGVKIKDRHRAMGDAYATYEILKLLIENDTQNEILLSLKRNSHEQTLPPNLPKEQFLNLPEETGVYYFHDEHGKIIYVGKAVNIKKRISSHFTKNINSPQRQAFLREIHSLSYELTGNELIALLLESNEIHTHWPKHNRAQKKVDFNYGIVDYLGNDGYLRLAVDVIRKNSRPLATFSSFIEASEKLRNIIVEGNLCLAKCSLRTDDNQKLECTETCTCKKGTEKYNKQVTEALKLLEDVNQNMVVVSKGRTDEEKAVILLRGGQFKGYGFVNDQVFSISNSEDYIKPMKHYGFAVSAINSFVTRFDGEYKAYAISNEQ